MQEGKLVNKQMIYSDPLRWGTRLLILDYGGYEAMRGNLSIGMFVIVYQFSTQLMESVNGMYRL